MCNETTRITDTRRKNRANKAVKIIAVKRSQRYAAKRLHINPGTVNHIKANTKEAWTHVTLTPVLLAKIELLAEVVEHDSDLSEEVKADIDRVMELETQLTQALRELTRKIKRL